MLTNKQHGFTLIEVIIALTIFALLAVIATSGLFNILAIHKKLTAQDSNLQQFTTGITLVRQDFRNFIDRPVLDTYGDSSLAFSGQTQQISFTRSSLINAAIMGKSGLQRIQYIIQGNNLVRRTWPVLDQAIATQPNQQILIAGLSAFKFQFLDQHGELKDTSPTPTDSSNLNSANNPLNYAFPIAIKISCSLRHQGPVTLLIPIATRGNNEKK